MRKRSVCYSISPHKKINKETFSRSIASVRRYTLHCSSYLLAALQYTKFLQVMQCAASSRCPLPDWSCFPLEQPRRLESSPLSAGVMPTSFGDHHVGCGGNGDRIHRQCSQQHSSAPEGVAHLSCPAPNFAPLTFPSLVQLRSTSPSFLYTLQQLTLSGAASVHGHTLRVGWLCTLPHAASSHSTDSLQ